MSGPPPAEPRPAATIVLLRPAAQDFEVLLLRRASGLGFMAGAHVFPGGRLDPSDSLPALLARCDLDRKQPFSPSGSDRQDPPPAFAVAALRELFEESGVLLARDTSGNVVVSSAQPYPELRRALHERKLDFVDILARQDLVLMTSAVRYFARWITPPVEPRRFDARFFLAAAPPDVLPSHDNLEATEIRWLRPDEALHLGRSAAIVLPPPTTKTLELLAGLASPDAALRWADSHLPVTVCPDAELVDGLVTILLPGDPLSTVPQRAYPGPTRYVLHDGAWLPG